MVLDQTEAESRSLLGDRGVELLAAERHARLGDGRFESSEIPNAVRAPGRFDDETMELFDFRQAEVTHQLNRW